MPVFTQVVFAMAGLAAAAGPVIIHLLNRRRYRVVEWAAMDFLREALQRNKRMLHLRDLLLLLLRTVCVLLFGLALARPYWSHQAGSTGQRGPVHAVLIVDNSQSMGYQRLDGTLLDEARRKALEFIDQLPLGSRISVVPLCGSAAAYSLDPYRSQEDAREALDRIQVVDRAGTAGQAIDLALEACRLAPDLSAKRVVFLGDQQIGNWPAGGLADSLQKLPELQVVRVGAVAPENAWIADFRVQDGIADVETQTAFIATVRYNGADPKSNVQLTLEVDGSTVASRNIDLEPGQSREVQFPYRFDVPTEPGRISSVSATVTLQPDSIPGDRLTADNQRYLTVPVVAALPVVFIDQYGDKENPSRNEYGETFRLRRLLAPLTSRGEMARPLIQIRHTTIEGLTQTMLEDARLVVIAGVASPGTAVPLLREYMLQGGQIFLAAGGEFDPVAWSTQGWLDGQGILPVPLRPELLGHTPDELDGQLDPLLLVPNSLVHDYFRIEDVGEDELADLYQSALFFKLAVGEWTNELAEKFRPAELERVRQAREFMTSSTQELEAWARQEATDALPAATEQQRREILTRREAIAPQWLLWRSTAPLPPETDEQTVERTLPQVLGLFSRDKLPAFIQRQIGRGKIVLFPSAVYSNWNDVTKTNTALVFDRILRFMLQDTLPRRTLEGVDQFTLPVDSGDRRINYTLLRPGATEAETLTVDALGGETYGVAVRGMIRAGHYLVTATSAADPSAAQSAEGTPGEVTKLWEIPLAVNGPERESNLTSIEATELKQRLGDANYRWIERDETISLEGAEISLQNLWRWLLWLVLVGLLFELVILAWPHMGRERTA